MELASMAWVFARSTSSEPGFQLRMKVRHLANVLVDEDERMSDAAEEQAYVKWLVNESMLGDASSAAGQSASLGGMWQNPYGRSDPHRAVERASVWFTAYPASMITRPESSFLAALGDPELWAALSAIGITAVHTGPVKRAGGISGRTPTPSVDGQFDRISTKIDDVFGSEEDFLRLCSVASEHGGTVIDDIVPGHTGKGPDFRLAEMNVGDYPGIYHMVEIPPADWFLLPDVPTGRDSINLDIETEEALRQAGHIVGRLQRVILHNPGIKDTNWSATRPVKGADGAVRRWVYLHYFTEGQPSINWLDPTFAGMRLVIGDALHALRHLGAGGLRLDANGFLGLEPPAGPNDHAWSEGHPLSDAVNQLIASMVRKVGGFTFQELNLAVDDIKRTSEHGADLSYDFVNRPAYVHALATGDTEFLRLTLNTALAHGVQPITLVHALQNHDEMTYELVHFASTHRSDPFRFRNAEHSGAALAELIRGELIDRLTGAAAPYNAIFTTNGIACTMATIAAAALGYRDCTELSDDQIEQITRAHLLMAMFNAWQPGVFALSGWDLTGALTLPAAAVASLIGNGDTRWLHRAGYQLTGSQTDEVRSSSGVPRGTSLYGTIPEQLARPRSFASRLAQIIDVRRRTGLATAVQLDVPTPSASSVLIMIHRLPNGQIQATVLNFADRPTDSRLQSRQLPAGGVLIDATNGRHIATLDDDQGFDLRLDPYGGLNLLVNTGHAR
jgi:trehalose synthase